MFLLLWTELFDHMWGCLLLYYYYYYHYYARITGIYHGVELLNHKVCKCSTWGNNVSQLFKVVVATDTPNCHMLEILSLALHCFLHLVLPDCFIFANWKDVKGGFLLHFADHWNHWISLYLGNGHRYFLFCDMPASVLCILFSPVCGLSKSWCLKWKFQGNIVKCNSSSPARRWGRRDTES